MATVSSLLGFTYIKANQYHSKGMATLKSVMLRASKNATKSSIMKKAPSLMPESDFQLKASAKGFGLFTKKIIQDGQTVLEYKGQYTNSSFQPNMNNYTLESCNGIRIDACQFGSLARFVNSSHKPNCVLKCFFIDGILRAFLIAQEDIDADTEITYSYRFQIPHKGRNQVCLCDAAKCKKMLAKRSPSPKLVCKECNLVLRSASKLKLHLMTHTDEKPYTCAHCKKPFRRKYHLHRHIKYVHEGTSNRVQCPTCKKQLSSSSALKEHRSRKH